MTDRTRSGQASRRQVDLASRRAGTGPALRARQLRIGNPVLRGLARAAGIRTRDQSWRIGAAGEVKVGARLDRLRGHGWRVLHSIPLGRGGDIDHLIIGTGGVFTANTKHHPNARVTVGRSVVFVRGFQVTYIGKALREASRVQAALSSGWAATWWLRMPGHRSGRGSGHRRNPDIERLYAAARDPATWRRT